MHSTLVFLAFVAIGVCTAENATTAAPTVPTTVAPPPALNATWTVKDKDKLPCLILSVAMLNVTISYNASKTETANIPIDSSFFVDDKTSMCGKPSNASDDVHDKDDDAVLTLTNGLGDEKLITLELRLTDNKNITGATSGTKFQWYHALVKYNTANEKYFPGATVKGPARKENKENNPLKFFTTPNGNVYECKASLQYKVNEAFTIWASGVDAVAYKQNATLTSNKKEICAQDDQTNDFVPIIVGAALAALVVVVLIAYLIGRVRAKRAGGYESV